MWWVFRSVSQILAARRTKGEARISLRRLTFAPNSLRKALSSGVQYVIEPT